MSEKKKKVRDQVTFYVDLQAWLTFKTMAKMLDEMPSRLIDDFIYNYIVMNKAKFNEKLFEMDQRKNNKKDNVE